VQWKYGSSQAKHYQVVKISILLWEINISENDSDSRFQIVSGNAVIHVHRKMSIKLFFCCHILVPVLSIIWLKVILFDADRQQEVTSLLGLQWWQLQQLSSHTTLSGSLSWSVHLCILRIIMVALCNGADHNIFMLFLFSFFSSPNLSGRTLDVYHTLPHGVVLVRI